MDLRKSFSVCPIAARLLDESLMDNALASGGMAAINPDSTMAINATEAVAVEDLDKEVTHLLVLVHASQNSTDML